MTRATLVFVLAALAGAAICGQAAQDPAGVAVREGVARNVYFTAVDGEGAPATDLTPADVTVREDGQVREVLRVGPATDPMQVALLVDDSGPGIQYIRPAVADFVRALHDRAEFAIISTAGRNTVLTDFTRDPVALAGAVNRLATRITRGAYLLDGIEETARVLQQRRAQRPVIVVLTLEGPEFSSLPPARVLDTLRRSGAVLHVLSAGKPTLKTMTAWSQRPTDSIHEGLDENISRSTVVAEGPRQSGGRLEQVIELTGIPVRMSQIAQDLRDQLVLTYRRGPATKPMARLDVSVNRRGLKVRAPRTHAITRTGS